MKAFFSRLHIGNAKEKEKEKEKEKLTPETLNKPLPLPELQPLPPIQPTNSLSASLPSSQSTTPTPSTPTKKEDKLPDIPRTTSPPPPRATSPALKPTNGSLSATNDVQKKVAFINSQTSQEQSGASSPPLKTTVSRFQATHGAGSGTPRASTGASSSKTDLNASKTWNKPYSQSTRTASPSLRSGTPYSQMSTGTSGSRILAATSWSEVTEEDLVSNLGSRERTRQEVLFEIISSEERYVQELAKMKETFIDPLLHPYSSPAPTPSLHSTSPIPHSTTNVLSSMGEYDYYRSESPSESSDQLPPIAARFMSPTPSIPRDDKDTDDDDDEEAKANAKRKQDHPRSPYRATKTPVSRSVPFPSRSHQSLPPPPRANQFNSSTQSLGRQSIIVERPERERNYSQGQSTVHSQHNSGTTREKGMLRKLRKENSSNPSSVLGDTVAPHQLPENLRICLEVIDGGVFEGHKRLCEALKKRYDEQYPLIRSLADVFVANSDIFQGYAKYVLHLERALEEVEAALSASSTSSSPASKSNSKASSKNASQSKISSLLTTLDHVASLKGETNLSISLSKSFQRLLKYPLLFQNLLYHTDPSTFEYESTLQMVAEIEGIVRSIEDEKVREDERDRIRDVWGRIEGLEGVPGFGGAEGKGKSGLGGLGLYKRGRILLEERPALSNPSSPTHAEGGKGRGPPPVTNNKAGGAVKGKSSFKRLSDVLGGGSKKDLWLVVFNDVVLLCQRTGTTTLPISASSAAAGKGGRANSLPEKGVTKGTVGRRQTGKPRNLYKFVKIETWQIGDAKEGVVSMEDVARTRNQPLLQPPSSSHQPRIMPMPPDEEDEDDGMDSDDSDRKSKMSFSYWGADKVTVQKPMIKPRVVPVKRGGGPSYGRESSANAKFGTRLVQGEPTTSVRAPSRRTTTTTGSKLRPSEDSVKATVTKPGWNSNTRATTTSPVPKSIPQRSRNTSQTTVNTATKTPSANGGGKGLSPAPSEDSGVGLYRQMLAKDPSLNH